MDNASSSRESMAHLKAIYFLRPSADNVEKLRRHLTMPRFAEYHLFFSNKLKIPQLCQCRMWSPSLPPPTRSVTLATKARQAFLHPDNEMVETRRRLEKHTDDLGDLKMQTKKFPVVLRIKVNNSVSRSGHCSRECPRTMGDDTMFESQFINHV